MRGKLVASLVGISPNQLAGWRRRDILESPYRKGRRGVPHLYSWVDYQKARAAAALLQRGIANRRLNEQIADLDAAVEDWWRLPLSDHQTNAVVPRVDAPGYKITEELGPAEECVCGNHAAQNRIARDDAAATLDIVCELRRQGPLGRLCEFDELVNMDPRVQDGYPVIRGRRIETEMLYTLHDWGSTAAELADRFALTKEQVEAAIAFEQALIC